MEMVTKRWVDWFNNHRLFGPIGHIPPAEAEANHDAALKSHDRAAWPKPNSRRETRDASETGDGGINGSSTLQWD